MANKQLQELRSINTSLTTLGKVILALANQTTSYIPFRESKLTRLLQDSIGGNCVTHLIATVSPKDDCIEETISTLKFADRAQSIVQSVRKNIFVAKDDQLIHKLQSEISYLKELLQLKRKGKKDELANQLYNLK